MMMMTMRMMVETMDPKEVESSIVWQWVFGCFRQDDEEDDGSPRRMWHRRSIASAFWLLAQKGWMVHVQSDTLLSGHRMSMRDLMTWARKALISPQSQVV